MVDSGSKRKFSEIATEIGIIVGSILLAFALDAWWDAYREAVEARRIRSSLSSEFKGAADELAFSASRNRQVIAAADVMLRALRSGRGSIETTSGTIGSLLLTPTTDARRGTLDALIASGGLEILDDRTLQDLLADWPAELQDAREEELAAKSFVHDQLTPYLSAVTDMGQALSWRLRERRGTGSVPSDVEKAPMRIPSSAELINLIEIRRYLAHYNLIEYERLAAALALIQTQLESSSRQVPQCLPQEF